MVGDGTAAGRRFARGSRWLAFAALGAVCLAVAACSSGASNSTATTGGSGSTPSTPGSSAAAAVVRSGSTAHGTVLTNDAGMTLYRYTPDGTATPTCTGGCATLWPPVTVPSGTAHVAGGTGISAASLGTVRRPDGTLQVTYKGMPLYRYTGDSKAGDANGQGIGGIWFVIPASGGTAGPAAAPAATTPPTTAKSSGGYGY